MYALFMVFALLAVWMQVRILRGDGGAGAWIGYVVAAAALVYTQYFGILFVGTQQLAFAVRDRPRRACRCGATLAWSALLVLLIAPLVPFALDQFSANEAAGTRLPAAVAGRRLGRARRRAGRLRRADERRVGRARLPLERDDDRARGAVAARAAARAGAARPRPLVADAARRRVRARCPAIALFVLGQLKPFVFEVRYFIGAVPLALLLIARALTSWARRPAVVCGACAAVAAVLALGLADQQLNGSNPRVYDFKSALSRDRGAGRARRRDRVHAVLPRPRRRLLRGRRAQDAAARRTALPEPRRGQQRVRARARSSTSRSTATPAQEAVPQAVAPPPPGAPRAGPADPDLGVPPMTTITDTRLRRPGLERRGTRPRPAPVDPAAARRDGAAGAVLLRLAAAARPRRQPRAVRAADRGRAVQRRAGARLLVDLRARAPVAPLRRGTTRRPRSTCSSPSTTSRSRSSSRRCAPRSR